MILQKRPQKSIDIKFNIGSESIEIVQEYAYLGTRLTPTGNFTLALEHLKEKAPFLVFGSGQFLTNLILILHPKFLTPCKAARYGKRTPSKILKNGIAPQ